MQALLCTLPGRADLCRPDSKSLTEASAVCPASSAETQAVSFKQTGSPSLKGFLSQALLPQATSVPALTMARHLLTVPNLLQGMQPTVRSQLTNLRVFLAAAGAYAAMTGTAYERATAGKANSPASQQPAAGNGQ
jgi:hypothetical protein